MCDILSLCKAEGIFTGKYRLLQNADGKYSFGQFHKDDFCGVPYFKKDGNVNMNFKYFVISVLFWGIGILSVYAVRPTSKMAAISINRMGQREKGIIAAVMIATILLCTIPMSLNPVWNGVIPMHRNQYEIFTEAILDGHLYLDSQYGGVDPKLLEMENPYDPVMRAAEGVSFQWDHAFYNGHYYMYFGIVPVFLLFLPFRLITGSALTTYHATQVFTALFIVGIFCLFRFLAKKFFPALPYAVYLPLSASISIMCVWYATDYPALYCTAITGGLFTEIWSLFFFMKAVWGDESEKKTVAYGVLGSFFGALAFGCRPTIALANILAIPLLIHYIKGKKFDSKLYGQIALVIIPYVVIGSLLMLYNYVRFGSPFEFGQTYQLTTADQSTYGSILSRFTADNVLNGIVENFIEFHGFRDTFPYIPVSSAFFNFPICLIGIVLLFRKETRKYIKEHDLRGFCIVLGCLPILITIMEVLMSPYLMERYRMDIYWLLGLLAFLSFGILYQTKTGNKKRHILLLAIASVVTIYQAFFLWIVPADANYTAYFPESIETLKQVICLGIK